MSKDQSWGCEKMFVCSRYILGCSGTHPQSCDWDHWALRVFPQPTPSLRWPSQSCSSPNLCPSSLVLLITPPDARPSGGSLCRLHGAFYGFSFCRPRDAKHRVSFAQWAASKALTPRFDGLAACLQATSVALLCQLLVLRPLPLVCVLQAVPPWSCLLYHEHLPCRDRGEHDVWCDVEFAQVYSSLPVRCWGEEASCWFILWLRWRPQPQFW